MFKLNLRTSFKTTLKGIAKLFYRAYLEDFYLKNLQERTAACESDTVETFRGATESISAGPTPAAQHRPPDLIWTRFHLIRT